MNFNLLKVVALNCLLLLLPVLAYGEDTPAVKGAENIDLKQLPKSNEQFAVDLCRQLRQEKGNLFLYSISEALAMTYVGAKGETKEGMQWCLLVPQGNRTLTKIMPWTDAELAAAYKDLHGKLIGKKNKFELRIANALWGQQGLEFKQDFMNTVDQQFGGKMDRLDFAKSVEACKTINDWIAKQTNDKIKDVVGPEVITADTKLVVTNAIYFKAAWGHEFPKGATHESPFNIDDKNKVDASMMEQTGHFRYGEVFGTKVLEMPYAGRAMAMTVLLPDKGLEQLEKDLVATRKAPKDSTGFTPYFESLKPERVHVALPKFKFTREFSLAPALKSMGMPSAFDPKKADFSGMTDKTKLFISAVLHKAFVDVNEEGTEAAAATVVVAKEMAIAPSPEKPKQFIADHPFIFLIRDNQTGSLLFMGRVCDPTK